MGDYWTKSSLAVKSGWLMLHQKGRWLPWHGNALTHLQERSSKQLMMCTELWPLLLGCQRCPFGGLPFQRWDNQCCWLLQHGGWTEGSRAKKKWPCWLNLGAIIIHDSVTHYTTLMTGQWFKWYNGNCCSIHHRLDTRRLPSLWASEKVFGQVVVPEQ